MSDEPTSLLPKHGGYRKLLSFQMAQLVYDGTCLFCERFIDKRSRTHDQMIQAARSGVQNIAEGSVASGTSKKTELKLTNVARASLEELLLDYEDYLRHQGLRLWDKDSPEAVAIRAIYLPTSSTSSTPSASSTLAPYNLQSATSEQAANILICLIQRASYLLARQLDTLESQFLEQGGFTEHLYTARTQQRQRQTTHASDNSVPPPSPAASTPLCPCCGKPMVLRTVRQGPRAGQTFWGCSQYPACTATRPSAPKP